MVKMINGEYGIFAKKAVPAKRGFFGETWRLQTDNENYFVKIDYWEYHKEIYRNSLDVIEFMTNQGISFIPKIIKTKNGKLSFNFNDGVAAIFDFIDGENEEDHPITKLFEYLVHIYKLDKSTIVPERESFNPTVLDIFKELKDNVYLYQRIIDKLHEKKEMISQYSERLRLFSDICKNDMENFYITHGDAGGNCILNGDHFHIVDWDTLKLAPIERDAWFFMKDNNQLDAINTILYNNNIDYKLNPDRICYYCYYSFFLYLTEYLQSVLFAGSEEQKQQISNNLIEYLDSSWIFGQLNSADKWRILN